MEYRLEEIFNLQMGKTPSRNNPEYWNSQDNKWVSISDLSKCGKYICDTKEYISNKAVEESGISIIPENTVIMSFKLSIGKTAITPEPMYSNEAIMSFKDKHVVDLLPDYVYYMFSGKNWDDETNKAVKGKTLNKATLSKIKVSIHSIDEQRKIIKVLDKLQSIITHRQKQLEKLDELIKSRFVEMFVSKDYPLVCLDNLSIGKGEYGAQSAACEYDVNRPRYVRITDINDDGTLNNDVVSSSNIADDEQYRLSYGDFLFARMGATVGKTYAYKSGNQIYAGYLIRYKLNTKKIMPEYLYAYTRLNEYWNWVKLNQSGAAQPGINAKKYGSLQVPIAPIDLQNQFADFVKQVDKSKAAVQKELDKTKMLFDSLMQEYFG